MKDKVIRAKQLRREALLRVEDETARLGRVTKDLKNVAEAHTLLQSAAQAIQQRVHERIAGVVTRCLQSVYGGSYEFKIDFEKKRGRTEARLVFLKDGKEEDPLDGSGGGVLDVASLALRLSCLMLRRPRGRKLLVLDEPFKNVNGEGNRERAAALLESLAADFDMQIILTTGYQWLEIGKVIRVG